MLSLILVRHGSFWIVWKKVGDFRKTPYSWFLDKAVVLKAIYCFRYCFLYPSIKLCGNLPIFSFYSSKARLLNQKELGVEVKLPSVRETYKISQTSIPEGESHTFGWQLAQKLLPNSTFQLRKTLLRIKWSSLVDESTTDRSIARSTRKLWRKISKQSKINEGAISLS